MSSIKGALMTTAQVVAVLYVLRMLNIRAVDNILDTAIRG